MRRLKSALVVGGAGFYGGWLVEALVHDGVQTTVLDERGLPAQGAACEAAGIQASVSGMDLAALIDETSADIVFDLAGTGLVPVSFDHPIDDLTRNAATALATLEGARFSKRRPCVVFVSSAAVYGEGRRMPMDEEHPRDPLSPYGVSKLAAEHYVALYARIYGLATLSVRPFSLYGPGQRKLVVYDLLERAAGGESPLTVAGSRDVTRDFVFVRDAARALVVLARAAPASGEAYNLASGSPASLGALVDTLIDVAGLSVDVVFTGSHRPGDPLRWEGDASRARKLGVGFPTTLRDGLRETTSWFFREHEATVAEAVA
jgi:UDP-glucose 4-epimerase